MKASSSSSFFAYVQQIGRALMLPIAVLPIAALMLRLGQDDMLGLPFIAAAGDAVFSNLGLFFAIGIAVGLAKENHGAAGLAGAVGFFVTTAAMKTVLVVPPDITEKLAVAAFKNGAAGKVSVPVGIIVGLIAGALYNRFKDIKLPDYLAFFGGRRFVPIITGVVSLFLALAVGYGFPWLEAGLKSFSIGIDQSGNFGLFIYGVLNRLLIVTGLHHIINNVAWFVIGDYHGSTGDLKRFFAGDPTAGAFMSGFFPVMMFGLPAACLAMYQTAAKNKRAIVGGVLLSMALTSFLTGITEPIEFSFMFLAPALYAIHAVLTGIAMVVMNVLGVKLGFGFSAGLFDYVINWGLATKPWMLLPVGAVYAVIYYVIFRFVIVKFNLKTIGREDDAEMAETTAAPAMAGAQPIGMRYLAALGGSGNIREIDACTTRLRMVLANPDAASESALKALGARGVMKLAGNAVQVIIGPEAEMLADTIKAAMGAAPAPAAAEPASLAARYIAALGGAANIRNVDSCTTRLRLEVADSARLDEAKLKALGAKGVMKMSAQTAQVIIGPEVERIADEIKAALTA